jgi:hypothetical protein
MRSSAPRSPANRLNKKEIEKRIKLIQKYENSLKRTKLNLKMLNNYTEWKKLEKLRLDIFKKIKSADILAKELRGKLKRKIKTA